MSAPAKEAKAKASLPAASLRTNDRDLTAISDALLENGGILSPEVEAMLDALEGEREEKLEKIAIVRRNMLGHQVVAERHAEYYGGLAKQWQNAAERLKEYAHRSMRFSPFPIVRIKTGLVSAWRQRNSQPSLTCLFPERLPDDLRNDPPPPKPSLKYEVAVERWRAEFDRIVGERTALMGKEERDAWLLENLQALADEACARALPVEVSCTLDEHLRI